MRKKTDGGRQAKYSMFLNRYEKENAGHRDVIGPPAIMKFGKFKGIPVNEIEAGYLLWCMENMSPCPLYVLVELERRGYGRVLALPQSKSLTKKQIKREKRLRMAQERADVQRAVAKQKLDTLRDGVDVVGSDYQRLRDEWELAGGDEHDPPFGEDYEGPSLCWRDGKPMIVASEFRRLSEWE